MKIGRVQEGGLAIVLGTANHDDLAPASFSAERPCFSEKRIADRLPVIGVGDDKIVDSSSGAAGIIHGRCPCSSRDHKAHDVFVNGCDKRYRRSPEEQQSIEEF